MQSPNSWETVMIGNGTGSTVPRRAYLAAVVNEQSRRLVIGATVFDYAAAWARLGCTSYYSCFRCASFWSKYLEFPWDWRVGRTSHDVTSSMITVFMVGHPLLKCETYEGTKKHCLSYTCYTPRAKNSPSNTEVGRLLHVSFSEALCIPFACLTGVNCHVSGS